MSLSAININKLDYPILKAYNNGYNRSVDFIAGYLFPDNNNLTFAYWDFGDGTSTTTSFNTSLSTEYNNAVIEVGNNYDGFFPPWKSTVSDVVGIAIPKFKVNHTYASDGDYTITVTVSDENGNSFVGEPVTVNVSQKSSEYTIPENWFNIQPLYKQTSDTSLLFTTNKDSRLDSIIQEELQSNTQSISNSNYTQLYVKYDPRSSLPLKAEFTLLNVTGRVDIDYIEWVFDDGTTHVDSVRNAPVLFSDSEIVYNYPLLPNKLSFKPQVTLYITNSKGKFKITVNSREVIPQNRFNVSVSNSLTETNIEGYAFNITPISSSTIPVEAKFINRITPNLEYIIWYYDDGIYEVVPVKYDSSRSNVNQTITVIHKYNSSNFYSYVPECLFVYKDNLGIYTLEKYRSRSYVDFSLGLVNPEVNYLDVPTFSNTGYTRFNNIHILPEYTNEGFVNLQLRTSLFTTKEILLYDKLIWYINDRRIIQDKNSSENFGHLTIENFSVDTELNITVELYGLSQSSSTDTEVIFYDSFTYSTFIYNETDNNRRNQYYESLITRPEEVITTIDLTQTDTGVEIVTEVVDIVTDEVIGTLTIPTTGVDYKFDNLFIADKPIANFLNRDLPSTVSNIPTQLTTRRDIGYFRPSKTTNIVVEPGKFNFLIDFNKVALNTSYYFPDPYKYGSDTEPLIVNVDENAFKKRYTFSIARNEPNTSDQFITYNGYISNSSRSKYDDLSYIFDNGYVQEIKTDIYGNIFGLFKEGNIFAKGIVTPEATTYKSIIFNGYKFYDSYFAEGSSFNYSLTGTDNLETTRTGLTASGGSFTGTPYTYSIKFGKLNRDNYTPLKYPFDITTTYLRPTQILYRDGGVFMVNDTTFNNTNYFTLSYDGGSFTNKPRLSGSNGVEEVDGCLFISEIPSIEDAFNYLNFSLFDSIDPSSTTSYVSVTSDNLSIIDRNNFDGKLYVKDVNDKVSLLVDALSYANSRYTTPVYSELLSSVKEFDIAYNTYYILTDNYLVIDKIEYVDYAFTIPKVNSNVVTYNTDFFNKISNRFLNKNYTYFSVLSSVQRETVHEIVPLIYRFNIDNHKLDKIYPNSSYTSGDFGIDNTNTQYYEADTPVITYSEDVDMFNLSYLLKDQNKSPYLISVNFRDLDEVMISSVTGFIFNENKNTITFNLSTDFSTFTPIISSGTPTLSTFSIIL